MTCAQWLQIWPWEDVTCDCPWVLWTQLSQFGTVEISAANWGKSKLLWSAFWTWPWACQLALRCGEKNFRNGSHVCRPCISKSTVGEKKRSCLQQEFPQMVTSQQDRLHRCERNLLRQNVRPKVKGETDLNRCDKCLNVRWWGMKCIDFVTWPQQAMQTYKQHKQNISNIPIRNCTPQKLSAS